MGHKEFGFTQANLKVQENLVVEPDWPMRAVDIDNAFIRERLNRAGIVLLRGFEVDTDDFSQLIHQNSFRVTVDPARRFVAKNAQLVDAGTNALGLHIENGNAPRLPHLIWFYCEKAATVGSHTTYCDGVEVWAKLPEFVKNMFEEKQIMYTRHLQRLMWQRYVFHEVGGFEAVEDVTFADLEKLAAGIPGQYFALKEDGLVYSEFRCDAVRSSIFSKQLGFANSLLGPSFNYEPPVISFADGQPIPEKVWEIIRDVTEECTKEIAWQSGDVVIIDNTRFMHGRREILDTNRRICVALSYIA